MRVTWPEDTSSSSSSLSVAEKPNHTVHPEEKTWSSTPYWGATVLPWGAAQHLSVTSYLLYAAVVEQYFKIDRSLLSDLWTLTDNQISEALCTSHECPNNNCPFQYPNQTTPRWGSLTLILLLLLLFPVVVKPLALFLCSMNIIKLTIN